MSANIEKILNDALTAAAGSEIHVRMEMPYSWGITLSGEIDGKDIAVPSEFDFGKYAEEFKRTHSKEKYNIIDFSLKKGGSFIVKPIFDEDFQKMQDKL